MVRSKVFNQDPPPLLEKSLMASSSLLSLSPRAAITHTQAKSSPDPF